MNPTHTAGSAQPLPASARPRARSDAGAEIEWNGSAWVSPSREVRQFTATAPHASNEQGQIIEWTGSAWVPVAN